MVKYTLTLIMIAAFFLMRWLFPAEIKISPKAPERVTPGEEFTYEITISKVGVSGFAKIQQEIPAGCTAEQVDVKGASFSCVSGVVKMIWMSLPSEDEFTVSYKIKTDATVNGSQNITGKFSFLENNEKKSVDMPVTTINFMAPQAMAEKPAETKPAPVEEKATTTEVATASASSSTEAMPQETKQTEVTSATAKTSATASSSSASGVTGERRISKTGEGKYKVDISIQNQGLSGFAKMQDVLPTGMLGYEDNSNSAVFSFVSSKVKFVWMSVPDQRDIRVSYIVTANSESDLKNITGEFSYLDNNETKRVAIATVSMPSDAKSAPVAQTQPVAQKEDKTQEMPTSTPTKATETQVNTTAQTTASVEPKKSEKVAKEKAKPATTVTTNPSNMNTTASTSTNIPPTSDGVGYKVQVCASKKDVGNPADYFSKTYSFTEEQIYAEAHEGWHKYTIGAFTNYKGARDRRNEVTSKYTFPGPFVTAYNNGKRITVQEALMVTRDKWVP